MKKVIQIGVVWALMIPALWAQSDSVRVLDFNTYLSIVRNNHPMIRQTDLLTEKGDAMVLRAKGGFDPQLISDFSQKTFSDSRYYELWNAGLKVPTNLGIQFQAGFESNEGVFLNPENTVPSNGLWYAGISIPLGQGLLFDRRRAALRKAKIYMESTQFEQQLLLNELIFEASMVYWKWFEAFHIKGIYEEAERIAIERLEGIQQSALLGDRPVIDTVEAGIQVQNRQIGLREAEINLRKSEAELLSYLWVAGLVPLEIQSTTRPIPIDQLEVYSPDPVITEKVRSLILEHPELKLYQYKINEQLVDQQMQAEQLKPMVDLKINAISSAVGGDVVSNYNSNDYTLGLDFKFPIFLRKERGNLRLARLKVSETEFDVRDKQAKLLAKAIGALNEWNLTKEQVDIYERSVRDYQQLFSGEQRLFTAGESSVFMVNNRESALINARIKAVEIKSKHLMARLKSEYALGVLN